MDSDQTTTEPDPVIDPVTTPPEPALDVKPSTLDPEATAEPPQLPFTSPQSPPAPEPVAESALPAETPEQILDTPPAPVKPAPLQEKVAQPVPSPAPTTPPIEPPQLPSTSPQIQSAPVYDVNNLTDDQLKAAAALYAKKNQKALSQKGVEKRQAVAKQNIHNITEFIRSHSPASNRTIARALNLPPRRVQHYMQILTHNGTVTATGWGASRKYFKK